jgi:outer membrane cobalamin receptor
MIKTGCIAISVFLFSINICAQKDKTTISGFVTDGVSGEALYGTNILLYKDSINTHYPPFSGTVTNSYGFYAIPGVLKGKYFLIARYIGYKPLIREVEIISPGKSIQYNFEMITENISLEEIYITGEKNKESQISTINIPPELLTKLPSLSGEAAIFKALQLLPGIQTANEMTSGLYVRGGSPDQNLTLVDGVIFYSPAHLGNFSSSFNSDAVQSIKLIKGAFPAEYGGKLSSVLDVRLRSGTREKTKVMIGLGTLSSRFVLEGPIGENSTYMISGRKMYYDVIQKSFFKNSIIPRYNYHDLNSKIAYNLGPSDILWMEGTFSRDNLYSPPAEKETDYNIDWQNNALSINWLKINSKSVFINNSISYVDYRFRSVLKDKTPGADAPDYFSSSILRDLFAKTSAEIHASNAHVLKVGAEVTIHNYKLIYNDFYDEILEKDLSSDQGISALEAGLYFEDGWRILPQLEANLGGRLYYFRSKKYFRFEPRISSSYTFSDDFKINAAFAEAHQFLHLIIRNDISLPTDLWYPSSEEVAPAKARQYVFGFDSYFENREYQLSVEGYYKEINNLYEFKNGSELKPDVPVSEFLTSGKGEAYGIEFFLNKRAGKLSGWIGYTLSWTKRKFEELNAGKVFYPRYDRRHDISIVLVYNLAEQLSLGATWIYATGQGYTVPTGQYRFPNIGQNGSSSIRIDYTERNAYRLPAYHKLDLNASYKFEFLNLPFEAHLNIYNLYNRQNPFSYYLTYKSSDGASKDLVLNQITLFPFIPSFGIEVKF